MKNTIMKHWRAGCLGLFGLLAWISVAEASTDTLVLVKDGMSLAPIVVFEDAPPFTRQAADELAEYIEKTTGVRPDVIEGTPDPLPKHAIWVGYQPILNDLFPDIDFDFQHPEEVLIAANADNLVIAGRDRWNPEHLQVSYLRPLGGARPGARGTVDVDGIQLEYGTANAVYTFLQDFMGVRWFWPGALGEDVLHRETLAFAPFEFRYHPQFRGRAGLLFHSHLAMGVGHSQEWVRQQRLQLDSLWLQSWHPLSYWWDEFHETNPDYFALQPDGTRSGWPGPRAAKLCKSNPAVWQQWLKYVERELARYPNQTVFSGAANDGGAQGFCVCEDCRAWDPAEGETLRFIWEGHSEERVGLADRQIIYANQLARLLKERYPDKDYYVSIQAYGNSRPAPTHAVPDDNVYVDMVFNLHNRHAMGLGDLASEQRRMFEEWSAKGFKNLGWRPNLGGAAGWQLGMPNVAMRRAMDDLRMVAESNVVSINVDTIWEHWANQGPYYYILAQMTWNPYADGEAIMADYYQRAFGPAAETMQTYWEMMEDTSEEIVFQEKSTAEVWDEDFYRRGYALLDRAVAELSNAPEIYAQRVGFVRASLDYTRLYYDSANMIRRLRASNGEDAEAEAQARANWEELGRIFENYPNAFCPTYIGVPSGRSGYGRMRAVHPDFYRSGRGSVADYQAPTGDAATLSPAEETGWELVFSDDFERNELGSDWEVVSGIWHVADGVVSGAGVLATSRGFPEDGSMAFQRLEFEATADVSEAEFDDPRAISDLSAVLHGRLDAQTGDFLQSGYFFQFGWKYNTRTRISKHGTPIIADNSPETLIVPGKTHHVAMVNESGRLRLYVDGNLVIATNDPQPLLGGGNDRVGLFFYMPVKVSNVKLYTKTPEIIPGME